MKHNIILLTKERLISLDAILPIMMELKSRYPSLRLILILPSIGNLEIVKKNYHLWEAIKQLDAEILAPRRDSKIKNALWLLKLACSFLFAKNIIIKAGDTLFRHQQFIAFLKKFTSITEIKYLIMPALDEYHAAVKIHWKLVAERGEKNIDVSPVYVEKTDYCLSSLPVDLLNEFNSSSYPAEKVINTGYTRGMQQWTMFMEKMILKSIPAESKPYCLFILSTFGVRLNELDEPSLEELLKESLTVLKEFNDKITTVFRPHPITDIDALEAILKEIGYSNYTIDYGHPMILSSKALFVIGNFFSTTMLDAYYLGVPAIEYCSYDKELLKLINNKSYGGECCDFFINRNKQELTETVQSLLNGKSAIQRDPAFIKASFPETPKEFFQFFDKLLT